MVVKGHNSPFLKKKYQCYIEVILALLIANISIHVAVCFDDFL